MNQKQTLKASDIVEHLGKVYRPRNKEIKSIDLDIQSERTGLKVCYENNADLAFILINPKPKQPDLATVGRLVDQIFKINRGVV